MDVSSRLPELIRRPGITHWLPTVDRSIDTSHPSWAEFIETIPEDKRAESKMLKTHWPPSNVGALNLERWCVDVIPLIVRMLIVVCLHDPVCASIHISKTQAGFSLQFWRARRVTGRRRANKQGKLRHSARFTCVQGS